MSTTLEDWLTERFAWFYSVLPTSTLMVLENGRLLPSTFILINNSLTILPFEPFEATKSSFVYTAINVSVMAPPPLTFHSNFEPGNRVSRLLDQTFRRQTSSKTSSFSVSYDRKQWHGCWKNASHMQASDRNRASRKYKIYKTNLILRYIVTMWRL